ncbi:hypothetical protein GCM10009799_25540 [Nocardiopsis rhodophaea]|uniref:Uncharacterized protein n=1 Tax=Nocardiopsis rhodophaea TaxID=280238 RepID=A0ABN2T2T7_9ACTN
MLLRRLARCGPNTKTNWPKVFCWLRAEALRRDDIVGLLYYTLALGELNVVATELTERFDKGHGAAGPTAPPADGTAIGSPDGPEVHTRNGLLTAVTIAPHSDVTLDRPAPIEHMHELLAQAAGDREPTSADHLPFATQIRRLVAALWLAADPFTGTERRHLHEQIAADYHALALGSPHSPASGSSASSASTRWTPIPTTRRT